ncbi:MAG: transcriptional repressor [Solirubrobacteraceae bacterium]
MRSEQAARVLRDQDLRVTPQRRAILESFWGASDEHLSAEEVLSRASAVVPEIGRGTVYAALAELTELGVLASVGSSEPARYEINVTRHDHFRCRLCLRLFDVELGGAELAERRLDGYAVESVIVRAEGVCAACTDYGRGLHDGAAEILERPAIDGETLTRCSCAAIQTPVGKLALAATADGVVRIAFEDHADFGALIERARSRRGAVQARQRVRGLAGRLDGYFRGEQRMGADYLDWEVSGGVPAGLLQRVQNVPYAASRSYERLQAELTPYDCGLALGCNPLPILIPCHRVTRGSERPETYVGGSARLHVLHNLELDGSASA